MRYLGWADCRALVTLLDVAMIGCVMQHREANGSVLGFIARLTSPTTLARCPSTAADVLGAHLVPRAPIFVRLLLSGISSPLQLPYDDDLQVAALQPSQAEQDHNRLI
ncbi:hypothetical protein VOLCADRAFT_90857 [Volvox carteri f. nagariensis]|uniref:Secreted protein n=1 Tax=Volvox carteri f. nagariensis TaxID=3068 RepID=D8TV88_VOLCA|nr:uncharacterized protein VOLCADRAFT_90857 [Volvox carteri f. nagariensis]EFJ48661.1 hypothetical protein VOLCADRAFT_90857 [Volvox carteri f. nagariensis]|eukprot:XP_002950460.1 hypothetical protein VOLCADRAFT_90857 [Volvox carteri f. nagariensis]